MIDLKTATGIAKHFIVPTILALIILGAPVGYQFYKLHKEKSALADLQVSLEKKLEKSKTALEERNAEREAELNEKAKALGAKETEMTLAADQLKKSLLSLNQQEQECQAALAKLQRKQAPARQKAKRTPLKREEKP
jgi:uncharacterized membrane-anchored protein YhcB (DUF1043 family)